MFVKHECLLKSHFFFSMTLKFDLHIISGNAFNLEQSEILLLGDQIMTPTLLEKNIDIFIGKKL